MVLAMTMGGSGTAPAFSAAFGANVIRKSLIPGLFGIMVFLGAIIAGRRTATTMGKGLLNPDMMSFTIVSIILFSVAVSLLIANLAGIPQSTSQATVMSVVAPAIYFNALNTEKLLLEIIAFVSSSLLLFASITKGIPSSLVQLNVAAILGIGVAKLGTKNIFKKTEVRRFFVMWVVAPVIAFSLSLFLTYLADKYGYL